MKSLIGIRREDKNPWERRVPLIPTHIRELIESHGLEIWVQPSTVRAFPDSEFVREGARLEEDLSPCSIVLAVKEIPLPFFAEDKVYIFFSHTTKGQPFNMPMLKKMIERRCTLIDYEKIVNDQGQRLLFFGKEAGQAGMIDTLWALGQRLQRTGKKTPFSSIEQAYKYTSLVEAKEAIQKIGWRIHNEGLDQELVPLICGFAGYGHVSQGAQGIFDLLPFEEITPEKVADLYRSQNLPSNKVYKVVFKEEHMVAPVSADQKFELQDYYDHPQKYKPVFETYLPFLTVLVNCIYWTPDYPRFVTKEYLKHLWEKESSPRLKVIGDISCDVEGSVECTVRATDPGQPVYVYDPLEDSAARGVEGRGVVVMAVDNLPAEIPLESSVAFSQALKPLVPAIAQADFSGHFSDCGLPNSVKRAVILYQGEFTSDFEYMKKYLE
jgi:alpha-aminoadipic semialdehyde synthase